MKKLLLLLLALLIAPVAWAPAALAKEEQAVFAGGCFWCMEHDMQGIPDVISVMSGYTGGKERNPTYEQVSSERTGHYEAVRVTFDSAKITYEQLLGRYWKLIDPTDDGGQFCDRGPSYRSAIFATPEQKAAAEASKAKLIVRQDQEEDRDADLATGRVLAGGGIPPRFRQEQQCRRNRRAPTTAIGHGARDRCG